MEITLILPVILVATGLFLIIRLRGFYLLHPFRTSREIICLLQDRDIRRSFFLALAGTLGVGNIFGVAAGIMIGGPGSLFWLFISSFFAMAIKYAETLLVFSYPEGSTIASVIEKSFGRLGRFLSCIYALLTILLALFMGSAMQSVAFSEVVGSTVYISPLVSGLFLVILLIPCLVGGVGKIEKIVEFLIPMTTIIYILMCFSVILLNLDRVDNIVEVIVSSAFDPGAVVGGGVSFLALREGFARGILSNEAGAGSSSMAHARARNRSPHAGGLFALCEVFFDTTLLCTMTGMAILLSVDDPEAFSTPMSLVSAAFSSLGKLGSFTLVPIILCFAYATVICWYYYGLEYSRLYLGRLSSAYPVLFSLAIVFSGLISDRLILSVTDLCLLFMSILTLSVVVVNSDRIIVLSKKGTA